MYILRLRKSVRPSSIVNCSRDFNDLSRDHRVSHMITGTFSLYHVISRNEYINIRGDLFSVILISLADISSLWHRCHCPAYQYTHAHAHTHAHTHTHTHTYCIIMYVVRISSHKHYICINILLCVSL